MSAYTPPPVWTHDAESGGRFAKINRPTSGAQREAELPMGKHRFQLHSLATPNGVKVTVMLEELLAAGHDAEYDAYLVDIGEGEQFGSGFVALNPNSKIPAMLDRAPEGGGGPIRLFESGAILVYLAETFGAFLPSDPARRAETMNWLMWQMGSAPFLGGGFGHFYAYAPEKYEYPINRYAMETKRQLDVLDKALATRAWIAGDEYTIADMAIWPWYGQLCLGRLYGDAATFLSVHEYEHLMEWAKRIDARDPVQRGRAVNRNFGDEERLKVPERHSSADTAKVTDG